MSRSLLPQCPTPCECYHMANGTLLQRPWEAHADSIRKGLDQTTPPPPPLTSSLASNPRTRAGTESIVQKHQLCLTDANPLTV